jgi:hypothetical protein
MLEPLHVIGVWSMNLHDFSWLKVHLGLSYLVVDQFSSLLNDSNFLAIEVLEYGSGLCAVTNQ